MHIDVAVEIALGGQDAFLSEVWFLLLPLSLSLPLPLLLNI
jgi:hypothetical protein